MSQDDASRHAPAATCFVRACGGPEREEGVCCVAFCHNITGAWHLCSRLFAPRDGSTAPADRGRVAAKPSGASEAGAASGRKHQKKCGCRCVRRNDVGGHFIEMGNCNSGVGAGWVICEAIAAASTQ